MVKIVNGDILQATEDIICHQVNCQNVMGSGVAKALYTQWPEVKKSYHLFCRRFGSPEKLLGQVQLVEVANGRQVANIFPYGFGCGLANGDWKIVYNMIETYFKDINVTIYKLQENGGDIT